MVIFTTLMTLTELAITPIKFQAERAFYALWRRAAPLRLHPVRGRDFRSVIFCSIATFLVAVPPLNGPSVSVVSVWMMWAPGGAQGVQFVGLWLAPFPCCSHTACQTCQPMFNFGEYNIISHGNVLAIASKVYQKLSRDPLE